MINIFRISILASLVWVFGSAQLFAQPVQFFQTLQDIPLMPGLVERSEDTVFFDKPGGRVVESVADMSGFSEEDVERYYMLALPQFGWKSVGQSQFSRQNESLVLVFETEGDYGVLRVLVQPR